MKTKEIQFILLLILCLCSNFTFAQELLFEDITKLDDPPCFIGETDACVTIIADKSLNLGFRSNLDRDMLNNQEIIGQQVHYYLHFKTGGQFDSDRVLEVFASTNPNPLKITLPNLQPKEAQTYLITVTSCFDALFQEGNKLFSAGQYLPAKNKYEEAQKCFDKKLDGELEKKIVQIDSTMSWISIANESFALLDYAKAAQFFHKVYSINPTDNITNEKEKLSLKKNEEFCKKYFDKAKFYLKEHEYEKSLQLFQKTADLNCSNQYSSVAYIDTISRLLEGRRDRNTVFTYQIGFDKLGKPDFMLPLGFSVGGYYNKKNGGYFSFFTNPEFFNMLRTDTANAVKANIGISFGVTFKPIKDKYVPLWLGFGTGYTFMGAYTYQNKASETVRYEGGTLPDTEMEFVAYHAVPVETSFLLKIKWLAIRYTLQYRFAFQKEYENYMGRVVHGVGIGVCF